MNWQASEDRSEAADGGQHPPAVEAHHGHTEAGAVLIDIGPGVGAAVIRTEAELVGREIEIRPAGAAWTGTHTAVRERRGGSRVQYAGVFGSLPEGPYEARLCGSGSEAAVIALEVRSSAITDVSWPQS